MNTRTRHLKMKIKTLAAEAGIIRAEEQKLRSFDQALVERGEPKRHFGARVELADHRRGIVRQVARHALLAYALLREVPYDRVEAATTRHAPDWAEIRTLAKRFGAEIEAIDAWLEAAKTTAKRAAA